MVKFSAAVIMEVMPAAVESIKEFYSSESLAEPALMKWPLNSSDRMTQSGLENEFKSRLGDGLPDGLLWMEGHADLKYRPERILPGCRSVLVSYLNYYRKNEIDRNDSHLNQGRVARYARGRDYHKELGFRLKRITKQFRQVFPGEQFRYFTDTGPVDEVWLASASGTGFRGRHGLTIIPGIGSWIVLGHILTTVEFDAPSARPLPSGCPANCRRCIDACPGTALEMPGRINPVRCIAYQSIEHRGAVDREYRRKAGNWIFGCDVCQEVCPFNSQAEETTVEGFLRDYAGAALNLVEILTLRNRTDVLKRFSGSPLMRAGRAGLVRNACTVAGNIGGLELVPVLEKLINDENSGIGEHAVWALEKIRRRFS